MRQVFAKSRQDSSAPWSLKKFSLSQVAQPVDHGLRVVAHKVDRLAGVVDVGGQQGDDVVRLLSKCFQDRCASPENSLLQNDINLGQMTS